MPRKQRFKPSRKPKPVDASVIETARPLVTATREGDPNIDPARAYESDRHSDDVETGQPMRSQDNASAVVEETSR